MLPLSGGRLRALVARLALEPGRVVSAEALMDAIWGEGLPANGANALQALVSRVRRVVGAAALEGRAPGYVLHVGEPDVDALRFERLAALGRERGDATLLREAEALWRGTALDGLRDARFADAAAVRLEGLRLAAAEERLALELAAGGEVLGELEPLAAAHPLAERLQGLLIRALYAAGRQAEALAAYDRTRDALADELGIDPSPELAGLRTRLLRQDEVLAPRRRGNLRARLNGFVGRADELAGLRALMDEARLVTVVGPGGVGKTRLAVEAAAGLDVRDGVWLVELAAAEAGDVATAVLRAIGTREAGLLEAAAHDAAWRLAEYFAEQRAVLLLDDCEHVVDAVAVLAERLVAECPGLRVLATSRESLGVPGERLFPLGPLGEAATELFAERARAVRPDFRPEAEAGVVAEICRRLDGLPLAIELAAARLRSMSAAQIAARLDDRFALLSAGPRTAAERHRTLEAVVAWSWEPLTAAERDLATRLAVSPGGVAAAHVADTDLDALSALVDKSLVQHAGDRYRMLETIRSYALARLAESGRADEVTGAHAQFFLALAEDADAALRGAGQLAARALLAAEHENLLAALRYAAGDAAVSLRLVAALFWFWHLRGLPTERTRWTRAALAIPGAPPELAPVAEVLRGLLAYESGAFAEGAALIAKAAPGPGGGALFVIASAFLEGAEARAAAERLSGASGWERGMALLLWPGEEGGRERVAEALREFTAAGERYGLSSALRVHAQFLSRDGDLAGAVDALRRAAVPVGELDVPADAAEVHAELTMALARLGDLAGAGRALARADELAAEVHEPRTAAYVRVAEAELRFAAGDLVASRALLDVVDAAFAGTSLAARARTWTGGFRIMAAVLDGDLAAARAELRACVPDPAAVPAPDLAMVAHAAAALALAEGEAGRAAFLLGAAASLLGGEDRRGYDAPLRPAERARELLGERFAEAYGRGAGLGAAEAVAVFS
ncbi:SARP family transcriptional regulator [Actinorhabdospora filicis]|uniref:SARP family transcriptional regulator n=1 Tax=Actinorhabdospora filicis TaxID=1785913 RepID=A0A9W6SVQ6_9ACTN|nr:SARP family transcriptional regulator [Actinorhabdospora filicis]